MREIGSDQARRFLAWADTGAYTPHGEGRFDIGNATAAAFAACAGATATPNVFVAACASVECYNGSVKAEAKPFVRLDLSAEH